MVETSTRSMRKRSPPPLLRHLTPAGIDRSDEWPSVVDLLVVSGLAESRGAARRTIKEGGAYLNERIVDESALVDRRCTAAGGLRRGKKSFASVELQR